MYLGHLKYLGTPIEVHPNVPRLFFAGAMRQKRQGFFSSVLLGRLHPPTHTHHTHARAKTPPPVVKTNRIASPCPKLHVLFDFTSSFYSSNPAILACPSLHLKCLPARIQAFLFL